MRWGGGGEDERLVRDRGKKMEAHGRTLSGKRERREKMGIRET